MIRIGRAARTSRRGAAAPLPVSRDRDATSVPQARGRAPKGKISVCARRPKDAVYARIHILHRPAAACRPRPTRLRRGEPRLSRAQGDATLGSISRTHGDPGREAPAGDHGGMMATSGSHRMQPFTVRGRRERRRTKRDPWERCQGDAARAARNAARASPHPGGDASAARPIRWDEVTPEGMYPPCRHPRHARHTGPKGPRPFGAQGSGDGAVHPRETPHGHAVAGMPVRVAAVAIPPRPCRPSGPSRSRWSRHPRNRPGRQPIRRRTTARRPRTSRRR